MYDLQDAVCEGDLEEVKRLVAEGADVAEADVHGFTALLWAAFYGHIPIIDWLLSEGGSSLAEHTILNSTHALMLRAIKGHFPAMQYLLEERGVSISETNNVGDTVSCGATSICREMLAQICPPC
jgi:ankyrin repeat protein